MRFLSRDSVFVALELMQRNLFLRGESLYRLLEFLRNLPMDPFKYRRSRHWTAKATCPSNNCGVLAIS